MSSCWWHITVPFSRTCYVMNDTKKAVCSLSTFPVMIIYCWKARWFLGLFPSVLILQTFMPKQTRESNSEGRRGKWYMEPREDARVSGEAARSTRVSSRVTSRDSPKWRAYSKATSIHEPIQIILCFLKVFQQMMTWIVAIHDRTL